MGDLEHALSAYEHALRHNPMSLSGLTQVAGIARIKENYPKVKSFSRYFKTPLQKSSFLPGIFRVSADASPFILLILLDKISNDVMSILGD